MAKHGHPPKPTDPHRLLVEANAAFIGCDHDRGSALLWQAAECALVNLARQMGRPHDTEGDDLLFFCQWLDQQTGTRDYTGGYTAASLFGDNARYHFIEKEEMEFVWPQVHDLIAALTSYPVPAKSS